MPLWLSVMLLVAMVSATPGVLAADSRIVYTSQGTLLALSMQPAQKQRYVLVSENVATDDAQRGRHDRVYAGEGAKLRFVRLDLQTGDTTVVKELGPPAPVPMLFDRQIAYARDGRIAYCEGIDKPFTLHVVEPNGRTRSVPRRRELDMILRPVWHPDSAHLLFFEAVVFVAPARQDAVLATVSPSGITERKLPSGVVGSQDTTWSDDGHSLYWSSVTSDRTVQLWRTTYPSLACEAVAAYSLGDIWEHANLPTFLVAEESGDIVWLAFRGDDTGGKFEVWRLAPGARPKRTSVTLDSRPRRMALSPDGQFLAVVQPGGRLAVAQLSTGTLRPIPNASLGSAESPLVLWALGGDALLVEREGAGQLALVPFARNAFAGDSGGLPHSVTYGLLAIAGAAAYAFALKIRQRARSRRLAACR
jgi:hypothetical protein